MTNPAPVPDPRPDASEIEKADVAVVQTVAEHRKHPLVRLAGTFSEVADQPQLTAVCGATLLAGLIGGDPRLTRTGLRMLACHGLATLGKNLIKNAVDRTRPYVLVEEGRYEMRPGHSRESENSSFPSGHTASAMAVARAVAGEYPSLAVPAYGAAAAVAAIQVPRCKHYPSDLAGGLLVGLAASAIVDLGFSVLTPDGPKRADAA
ncbi:MAG TPA: phosphatase PAP2 family protein [Mesorhizobium sp.]|jgi:membrane-associated phospholipid phosphatase|nr:phosphatase PAP2 family protein [Mesorhizobium sp.]